MNTSQDFRRAKRDRRVANRCAFTMLEIMTSVTLALMLMYAVARIFSRVGGAMNETTSVMEMTNALRNAKHQLTTDLENLSVEPAPPRNSRRGEGFLCYVEGMGGPWSNVFTKNNGYPFEIGDIALDTERYEDYGADGMVEGDHIDNTVGDTDDILSFTTKVPDGQTFRGRYIEPVYDDNGVITTGKTGVFESQYAEIIWFVRGTTLYRRILPIISDSLLQDSFRALALALDKGDIVTNVSYNNIVGGFGFYRFYDASVHLETRPQKDNNGNVLYDEKGNTLYTNSVLVANTLGDLSNRENRYFYWNSCGKHKDINNNDCYSLNLGGAYGIGTDSFLYGGSANGLTEAWYWLRMATLQESASVYFRAGAPYGQHNLANDRTASGSNLSLHSNLLNLWPGYQQSLTLTADDASLTPLGKDNSSFLSCNLPSRSNGSGSASRRPFIDFWNHPNVWEQVNYETGDLDLDDISNNSTVFTQDVILTNVLSFNVKVWDPKTNAFVDLGSNVSDKANSSNLDDPDDLRSYGRYARFSYENNGTYAKYGQGTSSIPPAMPSLPCVYDTWTEQYQSDYSRDYPNEAKGVVADIPLDGAVTASQLKDYPPPYNAPLKSMQIELRVFDPRSKNIRNATFIVDFSHAGE